MAHIGNRDHRSSAGLRGILLAYRKNGAVLAAALWAAFGAASLPLGAWLAVHWRPAERTVGLILGFGAGTLLGAIAYELLPTGSAHGWPTVVAFAAGCLVFFFTERAIAGPVEAHGSAGNAIVLGALLDGVPESLVLGMSLASGGHVSVAFFAAVFLSNLPEALGATAALRESGRSMRTIYRIWGGIVVIAGISGAVGYWILRAVPHADGSYVKAFAAGAVLTMLANSMIPEAVRDGRRYTGLLVALGFAVAGALALIE
jgi:ZIP family zinc transporter